MKVTLTRVGGYDPALGRVVDPTLETTMPRGKKKTSKPKRRTVTPATATPTPAPRAVNDEFEYMTKFMRYDDLPTDGTPIPSSTWEAFAVVPRDGESCLIFFHRLIVPGGPAAAGQALSPDPNGVESQL